jgi:hypothetical protein
MVCVPDRTSRETQITTNRSSIDRRWSALAHRSSLFALSTFRLFTVYYVCPTAVPLTSMDTEHTSNMFLGLSYTSPAVIPHTSHRRTRPPSATDRHFAMSSDLPSFQGSPTCSSPSPGWRCVKSGAQVVMDQSYGSPTLSKFPEGGTFRPAHVRGSL